MPLSRLPLARLTPLLLAAPILAQAQDWTAAPSTSAATPKPVSPGAVTSSTPIAESCPTFSWGAIPGARRYELALYDAHWNPSTDAKEQAAAAEPLQQIAIDAPATAWTPAGEQCLQDGAAYVWFVRAETAKGFSPWSPGAGFEIGLGVDALSQAVRRELAIQLQQPAVWRDVIQQALASNTDLRLGAPLAELRSAASVATGNQEDASSTSRLTALNSRAAEKAITADQVKTKLPATRSATPATQRSSFPNPAALKITGPNGVVFVGEVGDGEIPAEGRGTRFMWYPGFAAFRVGYVTGGEWDEGNIG